jgi:hypothetical protein
MSEEQKAEFAATFREAAENTDIIAARFAVLNDASVSLARLADILQTSGWIGRDQKELAAALLIRIASELSGGIALLIQSGRIYSAGALLRQLIEVEYLLFLGYSDPAILQKWYQADAAMLRKMFTPQQMRKGAQGIFRDKEYWLHCEMGGHPHPTQSKVLLSAYVAPVPPIAFLLPDTVQHLRRLWNSIKLLLPKLNIGDIALNDSGERIGRAIAAWEAIENATVLSFDGILA